MATTPNIQKLTDAGIKLGTLTAKRKAVLAALKPSEVDMIISINQRLKSRGLTNGGTTGYVVF